ncbi:MAG: GNAT family N-acetyltransferase [Silicimonas sp.]|jgi:putative hemolysin|nr:GNAT family N-acetyltransferase [Silicimonas sp.]
MLLEDDFLQLRLATSEADRRAAERLRYEVFVEELNADGPLVDHEGRFERDAFDPFYDHLVLVDTRKDERGLDHVVGVYRLLTGEKAQEHGRFYSEDEYDLSILKQSGRKLLELGRSCIRAEYRGGLALHHLWSGLAGYVLERDIKVLFGVASFHGTDLEALAMPLSHLAYAYLAPPELRVRAVTEAYQPMALIPRDEVNRVAAMRALPALIKSYLRLGGFVGDGAYVDTGFNTTDVCLVMDTERMSADAKARYTSGRGT